MQRAQGLSGWRLQNYNRTQKRAIPQRCTATPACTLGVVCTMAAEGEILVLVLSNGMQFSELAAVIDGLKNSSKSMGSHARREKYWQAYTKMNSKVAGMDGQAYCMLMYRAKEDGEGECSLMELTKRQKGLVNGACEFMGQKVKPPEDPSSKNWCLVFSEEDAPRSATLSVNILVLVLTHALVVPGHGAT